MSSDYGYNQVLYVEQEFSNPYAICDNKWHRIQAIYNDEELALKVDEMDQKYGLPTNINGHFIGFMITNALYIGGIPGNKYNLLDFKYAITRKLLKNST
jgi:laminin alpha 1/2